MRFHKLHGLGNDFILFDDAELSGTRGKDLKFATQRNRPDFAQWIQKISNRNFGVGCDQVLWLTEAKSKAHFMMNVINADGSEAGMCGNGIRAAGLYWAKTRNYPEGTELRVMTGSGLKRVTVLSLNPAKVRVDMGVPQSVEHSVKLEGQNWSLIDIGNPHAITTDPVSTQQRRELGPKMESNAHFPKRTNVEFAEVENPHQVRLEVFERGAGWTQACGSGACATAVALIDLGKVKSPVQIRLPGGELTIEWSASQPIVMTGPAVWVASGDLQSY